MSSKKCSLRELFSQEILRIAEKQSVKVLLFTHRQADPDALCAAAGLSDLLEKSFPEKNFEFQIVVPQTASLLSQRVCSQLGIKFATELKSELIRNCDLILIVDTADPQLLEPFTEQILKSSARKILVDHHSTSKNIACWAAVDTSFIDPSATSTCEIVTLEFSSVPFSKETARTLLTGLMFDSQHLGIATASTLEAALVLVRSGAEIDTSKRVLHSKPDRSEVLARIKSAQRLEYEQVDKFLILRTEVSSFHASVARMLLEIGADVGIAYGESDGEARVSVRSTQSFLRETGIDIAEQVSRISEVLKLAGGGHPTAASLSGKGIPAVLAEMVIQNLKGRILTM